MKKPRNFNLKIESMDACEQDEDGFIDGDVEVGRPIASFSFGAKPAANPQLVTATKAAAFSHYYEHVFHRKPTS